MSRETRKVLKPHCFDGTEVHRVVDQELRGLENEAAAKKIKRAIEAQYRNTVSLETAVEQIGEFFDLGFGHQSKK
jgi:hypothetical protein